MNYLVTKNDAWSSAYFVPEDQIRGSDVVVSPPPQTNAGMMTILERNYLNPSEAWWFSQQNNPWTNTNSGNWMKDLDPFLDPFGSMVWTRPRDRRSPLRNGSLTNAVPRGGIINPDSPIPVHSFGWIGAIAGSLISAGASIGAAALSPRAKIVQAPAPAPAPAPSTMERNLPIITIGGIGLLAAILLMKK